MTARASSFHFKGKEIDIDEVASQLGVNHVLEGSIQRSGNRLRVSANLVKVEDGFQEIVDTNFELYKRITDDAQKYVVYRGNIIKRSDLPARK